MALWSWNQKKKNISGTWKVCTPTSEQRLSLLCGVVSKDKDSLHTINTCGTDQLIVKGNMLKIKTKCRHKFKGGLSTTGVIALKKTEIPPLRFLEVQILWQIKFTIVYLLLKLICLQRNAWMQKPDKTSTIRGREFCILIRGRSIVFSWLGSTVFPWLTDWFPPKHRTISRPSSVVACAVNSLVICD